MSSRASANGTSLWTAVAANPGSTRQRLRVDPTVTQDDVTRALEAIQSRAEAFSGRVSQIALDLDLDSLLAASALSFAERIKNEYAVRR